MKRLMAWLLLACLLLGGCGDTPIPLKKTTFALDTVCTITLYDGESATLDDCIRHLATREQLWSKTIDTSDVARLNADGTATVNDETAVLLKTALEMKTLTDGAFDITTASLTDVWKAAQEANALPEEKVLTAALALVGGEVTVDGREVTLPRGASIDLGGIAKGHIADELADLIRENGTTSAVIDLGGNIVAVGSRPDGKPFDIGIAHPQKENALAATVAVTDMAVVTSGSYERGFTIGGRMYSHIIDPKTGHPVDNDLASVTVIAPKAATADALATACFVSGYDKAQMILSRFEETEAVFVLRDGTVKTTDGVDLAG